MRNLIKSEKKTLFYLVFFSSILLLPFLGSVHLFDWDEANFAELAREMILSNNYLQPQINYNPFYEKPPLFIWFQVASMKLFGINEFSARFPNALLGIIMSITLYVIGKKEVDRKLGLLWVMTYFGSLLPFMYFRTGLIDPWFNYFMFMSIYFFYKQFQNRSRYTFLLLSSLCLGLAVQTKGPVALLIVCGTLGIVNILTKFNFQLGSFKNIIWALASLFFSSLWFMYETYKHGTTYMYEFIEYQIRLLTTEDALHGGPFYYHFVVLLLGCLPSSIFLFRKKLYKEAWINLFSKIMIVCGLLVLILFSIVQTKIVHYSSMAYFPISFLSAISIYRYGVNKRQLGIIFFISILLCIAITLIPFLGMNIDSIKDLIPDKQTILQLNYPVKWSYLGCFGGIGLFIMFYFLFKLLRRKYQVGFIMIPLCILTFMILFAPKIERYTQGALIDFCEEKKGENIDILTLYLKSYAIYFYQDKKPFDNHPDKTHLFYLYKSINRPSYFILKNNRRWNLDKTTEDDVYPIDSSYGMVFYKRTPKN